MLLITRIILLQTSATVSSFILAMILHPEVQRKGQEEISRVCDSSQLPSYDDVNSLPYVTAIALEVLRWANPVPLSIIPSRSDFNQSYSLIFCRHASSGKWHVSGD
jgi:cytochrome P450